MNQTGRNPAVFVRLLSPLVTRSVRSHNDKFCVNYGTRKKIILTYIASKFILRSINYSEKKGV